MTKSQNEKNQIKEKKRADALRANLMRRKQGQKDRAKAASTSEKNGEK